MTSAPLPAALGAATAADVTLGRRIKAVLLGLLAVAIIWVLLAGHFWHHLGRITVASTRAGDRVEVEVSSPAHRAGLADLTAVARTSEGRTLRIQGDIDVPSHGEARAAFDFSPLLRAQEHVTTVKVKK